MTLPIKKSENFGCRAIFLTSLFLMLITMTVYWQVKGFDFVNFDDPKYIIENPHIQKGISSHSVIWAFTTQYFSNWHPLTWLSYMLDFQIFGLWAGGYHLVNLFLHIINVLLLLFIFQKMTGQIWQSGIVAALFALHPLHVESVAWISERKDVLSALFWMLAIWAYVHYVRRPGRNAYGLVIIFFIFGLMSKPMIVTLPFVLLLLDFWPLQRFCLETVKSETNLKISTVIREKIPLFFLSAASAAITFLSQKEGGAIQTFDHLPVTKRLANILVSYIYYIAKTIYPTKLVIFYPYPDVMPWWEILGAVIILGMLTGLAIRLLHKNPYIIVGWLWFLGTLVPVIGLIQVGGQSMADRYMYLPMIGLLIILAWGVPDLFSHSRYKRTIIGTIAIITISIASFTTWMQIGHWRNGITLFSHAIAVLPDNILAHSQLGEALSKKEKLLQAIPHYEFVLKQNPTHHDALINMGLTLLNMERPSDAIIYFNRVLEINSEDSQALRLVGYAMAAGGHYAEAVSYYDQSLKTDPLNPELHFLMGVAFSAMEKQNLAIQHYQKAIELKPDDTLANINLGNIYYRNGQMDLASNVYLFALQNDPGNPDVLSKLGAVSLALGKTEQAFKLFSQALKIRPDHPESQKGLEAITRVKKSKKN